MYDFYPNPPALDDDELNVTRFVAREASSTGGLGHPTDYGQSMEDFMRPAREAKARAEAEAELERRKLLAQRPVGVLVATMMEARA